MTLVVPFDGSRLSKAALLRAVQFEEVLDEDVVAVSAIPANNAAYARERGWLDADEQFDADAVVSHLREAVAEVAPAADFRHVSVDRNATRGTIANRLRNFARSHDASIVFLGSENAGRITTSLTVGRSVAADPDYDTLIVSAVRPSNARKLEAAVSTTEVLS
jgi:nucleotide-binding universal stress UspA family protein